MIKLENIKKVYFIGIGGIGVSAIARMMLLEEKVVSGSDESPSEITKELEKKGAKVFGRHNAQNLADDTDLVVYTVAIDKDNPELSKAKKLGIKALTYSQMLGTVSDGYYTVAVAGTHGKTTTTAMLAKVAIDAGLDPTVIVGSLLLSTSLGTSKSLESNLIVGNSNLFIVEACEYNRSFLDLKPNILVITNVDSDHLDYYKDLTDIQNAFTELANKLGEKDFLVCNPEDEKVAPAVKNVKCKIIDYSLGNLIPKLKVPGEYNQENAKAAFAIAEILKVEKEKTFSSLQEFEGVWRRFEYKGETQNGAEVYDDYAHHPTEIRAALRATHKKFPNRKIIVVFQPHLYSRTRLLLKDMADSFSDADEVLVAPIYAAREEEDLSINSSILAEEIEKNGKKAKSYKDFSEIEAYLRESAKKGNIIITMGAGDIYKIAENLIKS